MIKCKNMIKTLSKVCLMLLLYVVTSIIIVSIIDYWFLCRFIHDGHYYFTGIPADISPLLRFLLIRIHQDDVQSTRYTVFLLAISIVNYTIINIGLYDGKGKPNGELRFLSKYFLVLLFIIVNFRFFGDIGNFNIDKTGWYFIFVAIPTYLQLMAFCIVFFVILRNKREKLLSKLIYALPNHWVGRIFMCLSILYLTYYASGCIIKDICYQPDVFPNDFYFIGKPIKTIIQRFCFDNGVVVAINLGILLVSSCIYACILRMLNIKNGQSEKNGFYFMIKTFTLLMIFVSTVKYGSECLHPTDRYTYNMIINYIYWPLMIASVLLLRTLHHKEKAKKLDATISTRHEI